MFWFAYCYRKCDSNANWIKSPPLGLPWLFHSPSFHSLAKLALYPRSCVLLGDVLELMQFVAHFTLHLFLFVYFFNLYLTLLPEGFAPKTPPSRLLVWSPSRLAAFPWHWTPAVQKFRGNMGVIIPAPPGCGGLAVTHGSSDNCHSLQKVGAGTLGVENCKNWKLSRAIAMSIPVL